MSENIHAPADKQDKSKTGPGGFVRASNVKEIRHRRLLSTFADLSDSEIKRLKTAIQENQICSGTT